MKKTNHILIVAVCAVGVLAISTKLKAADDTMAGCNMPSCCSSATATPTADTNTNAVPDKLATCPVSGEKLNGNMGKPLVFTYKGQEVKLCCRSCKKDFDKDPDKFIAKIRKADKN